MIVYAYAESEAGRENIQYFLEKGLHDAADFVFVFNGETDMADKVPALPNIQVVKRPNTCFDLGAIGEVLRKDDLWKKYKRFITMNASLRGPFLPVWTSACWMDLFLDRVTDTTKVRSKRPSGITHHLSANMRQQLVGVTLNCKPRPHLQSMIFATDDIGMGILLDPARATPSVDDKYGTKDDPVGMSHCYETKESAIHSEIGTTGLITGAGYQVEALMAASHTAESAQEYCDSHPEAADFWFNDAYFGANLHPYETVFYKANRHVNGKQVASLTDWHLQMPWNSFDACRA